MPVLPSEARLLILATRSADPANDRALADLVNSPVNWHAVGQLAEHEKLLPVLWNRLRVYAGVIPAETAALLSRQAAVTEFRMSLTETILREAVERLAAENIRVMLLKGAALATTVYPSFAARPMGDLDVLVAPDEAGRAWQCLRDAGWKIEVEGGEKFFEAHHHLVGLLDPKGLNIVLEIHRAMMAPTGPFLLDEAEVWREARPVSLGATRVWVPSDRHQLLHLCIHFAWQHELRGGMGRTVRDVATLLAAGEMDWAAFVDLANRTRAGTSAYWTLAMARTLGGAKVPLEALQRLRPRQLSPLTRALERAYIMSSLLGACPSLRMGQFLWRVGMRPGASGHGNSRPWHVNEVFKESFHMDQKPGIGARINPYRLGFSRWLRFVRTLGSPRPIV